MRYIKLCLILICLVVITAGCSGTRFQLGQGAQAYGLSTTELMVLDTMDKALDQIEKDIEGKGLPAGKTATLEILGVHSPAHLHAYMRRLLVARLENRGVKIIKEKKVIPQGGNFYEDDDFEYWSTDSTSTAMKDGSVVQERLLSGAMAKLKPEEGNLPDLRIILALRVAGVDVMTKDMVVFEEEALKCRVDAKLCIFGDSKVKVFSGQNESPVYVYKRRILKFIPFPAPYKELETDRRSILRKLMDGLFGAGQNVQSVAASSQTSPFVN